MRLFTILLLIFTNSILVGCGRVSKPIAPDNSFYPHTYVVRSSENELNRQKVDTAGVRDTGENQEVIRDTNTHLQEIKSIK